MNIHPLCINLNLVLNQVPFEDPFMDPLFSRIHSRILLGLFNDLLGSAKIRSGIQNVEEDL